MHENVAFFGGDLAYVTIFGRSARASSVDRLIPNPPNPLPFRAAILQSYVATYGANKRCVSRTRGPRVELAARIEYTDED